MNLLYCGDSNIKDGLFLSIKSILKVEKEALNIYVLSMDYLNYKKIDSDFIDYLDNLVKEVNKKSFVKLIDMTSIYQEHECKANKDTLFTPYCMLRLYSDLVDLPSKILYLDTDVICRKDCTEFYNQDISNYELVGVLDHYGKWFFKNNIFKMDYINSGVLLLNIKKIKETNLFKKCREKCREDEMFMPDQSAINKISKYKKLVPRKYNEQRKLHKDTVFQHFTTSFRFIPWFHTLTIKPWEIDRVHKELKITEYDDIFEEYKKVINNMQKNKEEV